MSRAPWVLLKPAKGFPATHETLHSTTLGWRMVNPDMPGDWTVSLGEGTELLADKYGIARETQDAFALDSHRRAAAAWDAGRLRRRGRHVPGVDLARDESIRADTIDRGAGPAQAGVPHRRHGHGRQLLAAQRRCRGAAARRRGRRGGGRPRRRWRASSRAVTRRSSRSFRHRPGRGGEHRAARARASAGMTCRWSSSTRRSPRSRSPAWRVARARPRASSTPTAARSPSATRSAAPARGSSATLAHAAAPPRWRLRPGRDLHRRRPGPRRGPGRPDRDDSTCRTTSSSHGHAPRARLPRLRQHAPCVTRSSRCTCCRSASPRSPDRCSATTGSRRATTT